MFAFSLRIEYEGRTPTRKYCVGTDPFQNLRRTQKLSTNGQQGRAHERTYAFGLQG